MLPNGIAGSVNLPWEPARSTAECFLFAGAEEQSGLQGQNVPAALPCPAMAPGLPVPPDRAPRRHLVIGAAPR